MTKKKTKKDKISLSYSLSKLAPEEKEALENIFNTIQIRKKVTKGQIQKLIKWNPDAISQSEVAEYLGESRQSVKNWTNYGCPRNENDTYSLKKTIQWLKNYLKKSEEQKEIVLAELKKKKAEAILSEIRIAKEAEILVERESITRIYREHIATAAKMVQDLEKKLVRFVPKKHRAIFLVEAKKEIDQTLLILAGAENESANL